MLALIPIIVYRSRSEQAADEFMQEVGFPWIYDHFLTIVAFVVSAVVVGFVVSAFLDWRAKRRRSSYRW